MWKYSVVCGSTVRNNAVCSSVVWSNVVFCCVVGSLEYQALHMFGNYWLGCSPTQFFSLGSDV